MSKALRKGFYILRFVRHLLSMISAETPSTLPSSTSPFPVALPRDENLFRSFHPSAYRLCEHPEVSISDDVLAKDGLQIFRLGFFLGTYATP
jgi:hypothetical protein